MYIMSSAVIHHGFSLASNHVRNSFSSAPFKCCSSISMHLLVHRPDKRWDLVNTPDSFCSHQLPLWYCDHEQYTIGGVWGLIVHNY